MLLLLLFIAETLAVVPGNFESCIDPGKLTTDTYYIKALADRALKQYQKDDLFHPIDANMDSPFLHYQIAADANTKAKRALHAKQNYSRNSKNTKLPEDSGFFVEVTGSKLKIFSEDKKMVVAAGTSSGVILMYPAEPQNEFNGEKAQFTYKGDYSLDSGNTALSIWESLETDKPNIYLKSPWVYNEFRPNKYHYAYFCFQKKSHKEHGTEGHEGGKKDDHKGKDIKGENDKEDKKGGDGDGNEPEERTDKERTLAVHGYGNMDSCIDPGKLTTGTYYIKALAKPALQQKPKEDLFHPIDANTAGKLVPFLRYNIPADANTEAKHALHAVQRYDPNSKSTEPPKDSGFYVEVIDSKLKIFSEDREKVVSTGGSGGVILMYPENSEFNGEQALFTYKSDYRLKHGNTSFSIWEAWPLYSQKPNMYLKSPWVPNELRTDKYHYATFCFQKKYETERKKSTQDKPKPFPKRDTKQENGTVKAPRQTKIYRVQINNYNNGLDGDGKGENDPTENSIFIISIINLASVLITAFLL